MDLNDLKIEAQSIASTVLFEIEKDLGNLDRPAAYDAADQHLNLHPWILDHRADFVTMSEAVYDQIDFQINQRNA